MKKLIKFTLIVFILSVNSLYSQIQLGQDIVGDDIYDAFGEVKISADGNRMLVSAKSYVRVYQFDIINNVWSQIGDDIVGETSHTRKVRAISISGNGERIAIHDSKFNDTTFESFLVKVYEYNGSDWIQVGQDSLFGGLNMIFSFCISLSFDGNKLAIGEPAFPFHRFPGGDVNVYEFDGDLWNQLGQTIYGEALNIEQRDKEGDIGWSIALSDDGDQVAFGFVNTSIDRDIYPGRVRVYRNIGGNWVKLGNDIVSDIPGAQLGRGNLSMSSDGNTIAFTSELQNDGIRINHGVKVYRYNGNNWEQLGGDLQGGASTTISISGDGNKIVVSAPDNPTNDDVNIYIFNNIINDWEKICIDIAKVNDKFFSHVSLSANGNTLALSDYANNIDNHYFGLLRVYDLRTKISGTALFDLGENGCISMTSPAVNAKITITNGIETVTTTTDINGDYEVLVSSNGNFTISIDINSYMESKIYPIGACEEGIVNFCVPANNFDNITVTFVSEAQETEGDDLVHTVIMNGASAIVKTYTFLIKDQTASYSSDYTDAAFSDGVLYNEFLELLVVPIGIASFTITYTTIDDQIIEDEEFYNLTIGDFTVKGTIIDNDVLLDPTISDAETIEGDDLIHSIYPGAIFTMEKSYEFLFTDNTTNFADYGTTVFSDNITYFSGSNMITVPPGVGGFTVTIPTVDDDLDESDEYYTLSFANVSAIGTIRDNDGFPKYFTPNNDSIHDTWPSDIAVNDIYTNSLIYIYDRFGKLLKQINSNSNGWDGTFNGENMPSDDYWYFIKMQNGKTFKGHFSLKR